MCIALNSSQSVCGAQNDPFGKTFSLKEKRFSSKKTRIVQPKFIKDENHSVIKASRTTKSNIKDVADKMVVGMAFKAGLSSQMLNAQYSCDQKETENSHHGEHLVQVSFARIYYRDYSWTKEKLDGKFLYDVRGLPKISGPMRICVESCGKGIVEIMVVIMVAMFCSVLPMG